MDKVMGRSDDMLKIRGVNVFPSQIESVLDGHAEQIGPHYQLVVRREDFTGHPGGQGGAAPTAACWRATASWRALQQSIHDTA